MFKIFKRWWFIYWVIALLIMFLALLFSKGDLGAAFAIAILMWFLATPAFLITGLIKNIKKHNQDHSIKLKDWKFWIWLILAIGNISFILYVLIFNYFAGK